MQVVRQIALSYLLVLVCSCVVVFYFFIIFFIYFGLANQSGGTGIFFKHCECVGGVPAVTGGTNFCHFMPSILPLLAKVL